MTGWLITLALAALGAGVVGGVRWPRGWLALTAGGSGAALTAALVVLSGGGDWEWRCGFALGGEALHVRLDAVGALFLALLSVVGAAGAAYAREYWSDSHYPASARRGRVWWTALVLSMVLVLTSANGLHFLIAWEAFAICGYFLITLESGAPAVRAAGRLYLVASHAGTVCLFAFFTGLAVTTGGWDLGPVTDRPGAASLFWLALFGFGVKAGFFPLHVWLPSAHANAPSHVSAILSGVAIKMGIYGIVRFSGWLPTPAAAGWVVIGLGGISAVAGIAFAFVQTDLKRLLAYCSVENIGVIMIGLGAALLARSHGGAQWGVWALTGALLHVWNHGAFKALLFFGAGSVLHATGTREVSRLGGLWRAMPWTAGLFGVGAVAVAALPPLNGFVSELLIYLGLFGATVDKTAAAWAAMPAAIFLAVAGALALATFAKAGGMVFLGAPRTKPAAGARECGWWMRAPMLAMAGVCLAIGVVPTLCLGAVMRAAAVWSPAWPAGREPSPLVELAPVHLGLALFLAAAGVILWRRVRGNGLGRGPTWDCGYAAPAARMQYSGGSFSGIAAGWLGWLLRPVRRVRRPRGPFPTHALLLERVPDTLLERVFVPAGAAVMRVSSVVRRLQHGRLQSYVLYVLAGTLVLGAFVLFASLP